MISTIKRPGDSVEDARTAILAQLASFFGIGGIAALSYIVLSGAMIALDTGIADWVMAALCYSAFVGPVYLAHRHISFQSDAPHARALPRYILVQAVAAGLATLFSYLCYGVLGLPSLPASVIVITLTSGLNFAIVRLWAFAGGR